VEREWSTLWEEVKMGKDENQEGRFICERMRKWKRM
jgi:hypothetical protein